MTANVSSFVQAQIVEEQPQEHGPGQEQGVSSAVVPRTTVIPSLRVTQRYDSNVFFVPGRNLEDFVTGFSPHVKATHRNQWIEATLGGGAIGEVYAKNPGLNYVGSNGLIDLNLDGAMNQLVRGLGLRMSDAISYTPQPPAFAAPTAGSQISEPFVQGIQARRANSFTNAARIEGSYFFSSFMGVISTYTDRRIRFGKQIATPAGVSQGGFIDTNFQTLTTGLAVKLTPADTISFSHQYQKGGFSDPNRGDSGFSTQGALARWSRAVTPSLQVVSEVGFSAIGSSSSVYPVGAISIEWEAQYTKTQLSYSRSIAPSFFTLGTPLLSQSVAGSIKRRVSESLSLSLSGSYAINQSIPDSSLLTFESYAVTPGLEYVIGPRLTAALSYTRSNFQRSFSGQSFDFDRNMVMITLFAEWR
ncbi:MAG TPA: hypothetical protein PKD12_00280 [Nitrospira sp.]|nr:hypothetical protein [Nitrospira sp.]